MESDLELSLFIQLFQTNSETKQNLTFSQIVNQTKALAAGLQIKFGVQPKENIAIVLPSCLEYPVAVLGVNYCGAAATLINPSQTISNLNQDARYVLFFISFCSKVN